MPRRLVPVVLTTLLVLFAAAARAAAPAGGAIERTYDVRDLAIEIPDFNDAPELGIEQPRPAPEPAPAEQGKSAEALTKELIGLLRRVVPAAELGDAHLVAEKDGRLYLRGAEAAHSAVAEALDGLRRRRMAQVALEARLVRPDAKSLDQIAAEAPALARKLHLAAFRGGDRAGTALTEGEAETLRQTAGVTSAPRMTVFTGQNAYVLTATQRAYVASVLRKVGADGADAFEGVRGVVGSGVVFSARATAAPEGKSAAVHGRVSLTTLYAMADQPAPGVPRRPDLKVQVPDVGTETFELNAVAPDGGFLLFGVTDTKRPNPAAGAAEQGPLYLVLRATLIPPRIPASVH